MSTDFWMGIAIGSLGAWAFLIVCLISMQTGKSNAKRASGIANKLLERRNSIGIEQLSELRSIVDALDRQTDNAALHMQKLLELSKPKDSDDEIGKSIKVYRTDADRDEYLKARFAVSGEPFMFRGRRWRYEFTSCDDNGQYDVLWRPGKEKEGE
jgi:hypothetical protein